MRSASATSSLAAVSYLPDLPRLWAVAAPNCLRVLVAEDQPLVRRLMVKTIEKLGHEAVAAEDGVQAWELFAARPADVVITDWLMPGMDGLALCRRLRAECADASPYVILASILDDPRDVQNGLRAGADEYLVKPIFAVSLEARLIAVERLLRGHGRLTFDIGGLYRWDVLESARNPAHDPMWDGR
jgi:DNA-binding response OmpR family regulator